jgi:hypothetical protein
MAKKLLKSDDLKEPWVEAFKVGKVTDMAGNEHDFSEADLEDLNEGIHEQLKAGYQPPMVKGHPKVDDPRVGSVVDSKVENGVLKVKLDDVNNDFAEEVKKGTIKPEEITEQTINDHLWTSFMPDPELLIRTGGELRISNYLLWQCAYSEFYFCDTYWPDFDEEELYKAIVNYQNRQRRFGKTEAQVEAEEK